MSAYDRMTIAEIIYDYAVIRGDLTEPYARDQLAKIINDRINTECFSAGANLGTKLRNLVSDWQANSGSRDLGDPTASTWSEAAQQLLERIRANHGDINGPASE